MPGSVKNYQYTDADPVNGSNYYRLKMVDTNGKFVYPAVIRILFEEKKSVTIFPAVLTGGCLYVRTSSDLKNADMEVYEITGRKLQEIKLTPYIIAGQTITLPLPTIVSLKGLHVLVCKSAGNIVTKK